MKNRLTIGIVLILCALCIGCGNKAEDDNNNEIT